MKYNLLVILGPTASGKTRLAAELAHVWQTEVISADSRQVYRGMDIGTGKDMADYVIQGQTIPVHLINVREAGEQYNLHTFQHDFQEAFSYISAKGKTPILAGGSGLYIEAALGQFEYTAVPVNESLRNELEEKSREELLAFFQQSSSSYSELADVSTKKRLIRAIEINQYLATNPLETQEVLPIFPLVIGLLLPLEERRKRITERLHQRFEQGMLEEVQSLLDRGISAEKLIHYGLEYKFITQHLQGEMAYEEMLEKLNIAIHQFAKRQMTYFRHMEGKGIPIQWLDAQLPITELMEQIQILWNR